MSNIELSQECVDKKLTLKVKKVSGLKTLSEVRESIRSSAYTDTTSGLMPELVQGNLVILPKKWADEFVEFCSLNPTPCPLIGVSEPGNFEIPGLGQSLDIRIDVPEYHLFFNGEHTQSTSDISSYWHEDSVAVVIGCSFSFEHALAEAGLTPRNVEQGTNVSMYETDIATEATENFACNTVVSMRPYKSEDVDRVIEITKSFSKTHGAPIHVGDPAAIGVKDINRPNYGSPVTIEDDEVPVFWGCGVTTQVAVRNANLPFVITHAPGKMLITDLTYEGLVKQLG